MTYKGNPLLIIKRAKDFRYNAAKTSNLDVKTDQNTGFQGLSGNWSRVAMTYKGNPLLIIKCANHVLYSAAKMRSCDVGTYRNTGFSRAKWKIG